MMRGVSTMALTAAIALAGCAHAGEQTGAAQPGRCDAQPVAGLVGQQADAVIAQAQKLSGAATVRRYTTGDMLTMDFREDRLNVETDASGKVVKLSCG